MTRFQSISGSAASAASISNCDAPVATMMLASPRSAIAWRISFAPAAAAAFPICGLSGIILMSICAILAVRYLHVSTRIHAYSSAAMSICK